jgi:hypothetical protein
LTPQHQALIKSTDQILQFTLLLNSYSNEIKIL